MLGNVEGLKCEVMNRVAWVTLDRPEKLNSLTHEMMDGLPLLFERLAEDVDVRCVVLRGAGRAFCAGGDISTAVDSGEMSDAELVARFKRRQRAAALLHEMPKPTIAQVNGVAAGAGLSLALACDMRFAGPQAKFGTAFVKVAFSGDYGATWLMQRLVGPARARELFFTADVIDAREAERIGFVNRVVPQEQLEGEVRKLAERIACGPPLALARMKQNLNRALECDLQTLLSAEAEGTVEMMSTHDNHEALQAFLTKRPPVFEGR